MEAQINIQTVMKNWFKDTTHTTELENEIQTMQSNLFSFRSHQINTYQELLTTKTKQLIEGKSVTEHINLKFSYTLGELEEMNRLEPIVNAFTSTIQQLIKEVEPSCVNYTNSLSSSNTAHELNIFFIDAIMVSFEKEWKKFLVRLEETKKDYVNEQLPLSVSLVTKELNAEEKTKIQEKQAFLVGKITQLQSAIKLITNSWNTPYGTAFHTRLNTMRMALYHEISHYEQQNT